MYVLRIVSGPAAGQFVELDGELVIGRESGGLDIGDPQLSRRHAAVRLRGDTVVVEDLGSRNGTYVNGARINRPTRLSAGGKLAVGESELSLEAPDSATAVSQGPSQATRLSPAPPAPAGAPAAPAGPRRGGRSTGGLAAAIVGAVLLVGAGVGIGLLVAPSKTKISHRTVTAATRTPSTGAVQPVAAKYVGAGFLSPVSPANGALEASGTATRDLGNGVVMGVSLTGHPFAVLGQVTIQPGAQTGWHIHPSGLDGFIVVSQGKITMYQGNDPRCLPHTLSPGQTAFISGQAEHDIRNEGNSPAVIFALSFFGHPVQAQSAFLPRSKPAGCRF